MSIAAPPPIVEHSAEGGRRGTAVDELIDARVAEACSALWWAELVRSGLRLVLLVIGGLLLWVVVDHWVYSPGKGLRLAAFLVVVAGLGWYVWRQLLPLLGSTIRPEYAARSLERDLPELRQSLTSYVTLRGQAGVSGLSGRVVRSIGAVTAARLRTHDELPAEATGTIRWWIATACALAMLVAYAVISPKNMFQSASRLAAPLAAIDAPRRVSIQDVQPGDADAIAGRALTVSARIEGLRGGEAASCRWDLPAGSEEVELERDEQSRRYSGELSLPHSASGEVLYTIMAGDATAGPFRLRVQDVPVVALQSVFHEPPQYTGQSPHTSSSGAITALDGTKIKVLASTNRPVAKAKIEFNPRPLGDVIQATAGASEMEIDSNGTSLTASFALRSARGRAAAVELDSYRIRVWDAADQGNPDPIIYPIRVIADLPPEVSITLPTTSPQEVPFNAQQVIEVHASDPDYGLKHLGLEIRSGIDKIAAPVLWTDPQGAAGNRVAEYRFRPAELGLRIGDTVQVVAVAIDTRSIEHDPTAEPNLTRTDPIELKITAGEELPPPGDRSDGGPSARDERPASDHTQQDSPQPSAGQQGQPQGGGGSGQQGQGQQGEGQQGQGQQGQGQQGQQGEGQTGQGSSGEAAPGQHQSTKPQTGEGQTGQGQPAQASTGQETPNPGQTGEQPPGQPPTGPQPMAQQPSGQAQGQTGQGTAGQQQPGQPQPSQGASSGQRQPGQGESASQPSGERSAASGDRGQPEAGQSGEPPAGLSDQGQGGSSSSGEQSSGASSAADGSTSSPQHDGEAFERIRDHLAQKRAEQQRGGSEPSAQAARESEAAGESSSAPQGAEPQSTASAAQPGGDKSESAAASSEPASTAGAPQDAEAPQDGDAADRSPQSADKGAGEKGAVDQGAGEKGAGDQGAGDQGAGDQGAGNQGADDRGAGDQGAGDQGAGEAAGAEPSAVHSDSAAGNAKPSEVGQGESPQAVSGGGSGGDAPGDIDASPPTADPANLEYAKQATDLVLDYLQETRDAPDQELLEKLNWTKQDLQRFADRWRSLQQGQRADEPGGEVTRELAEALESLGLRPRSEPVAPQRDAADSLRALRDSGNRKPPPAAFREAFDAFRRSVNRP